MDIEQLLSELEIDGIVEQGDNDSYIVQIDSSDEFGKIFSKLEKSPIVDQWEENQVVTDQGSSLLYEVIDQPYMLNLIADFDSDVYQLIINEI